PWSADKARGPTFNAYLNGAGYWGRYGATDTDKDRFVTRFGPSELSHLVREGRLDVTAVLNNPAFGAELGGRLRLIEENGFLLKKLETYDIRYASPSDYEWAVPTGGHGLRFKDPRLVVTFRRNAAQHSDSTQPLTLPKSTDLSSLAIWLVRSGAGGKPTAVMPSPEEFKEMAERVALKRPLAMTEWQFARVRELYKVGGDSVTDWTKAMEAGNRAEYERLIR